MPKCDCCGNEYDKPIQVVRGDQRGTFDCFECAIQVMAPSCAQCGCKIIGHGVEFLEKFYCCVHCATKAGARGLRDRSP